MQEIWGVGVNCWNNTCEERGRWVGQENRLTCDARAVASLPCEWGTPV